MTKDEIDQAREQLRREMMDHPHKPYSMGDIGRRFGIPKHFIDRERALSHEGSRIHRHKTKEGGIRWTYVPEGSESGVNDSVGVAEPSLESDGHFEPTSLEDERQKTLRTIHQRRGQAQFRTRLLVAYGGCCAVTGCNAEAALEAAHIVPYRGAKTNHITNGLLLRADIHTLLDLNLIGIEPKSLKIILAKALVGTSYDELAGRPLTQPMANNVRPNLDALSQRWKWFCSVN